MQCSASTEDQLTLNVLQAERVCEMWVKVGFITHVLSPWR